MLELPDAEVLKENLSSRISGRGVLKVEVLRPQIFRQTPLPPEVLQGITAGPVQRRGHYLFLSFGSGPRLVLDLAPWAWVWHGQSAYPPTRTTGLRILLDDGTDLRVIVPGPRVPARAWVVEQPAQLAPIRELGIEPLSPRFTLESFEEHIRGRRRMLKELLVDPRIVAGVGDAYADEILYEARLSPIRHAHTLSAAERERLWTAIPRTLAWAVDTLRARLCGALFEKEVRDFLKVHGRGGGPCMSCGQLLAEMLFDDRRTNHCPRCQAGCMEPSG